MHQSLISIFADHRTWVLIGLVLLATSGAIADDATDCFHEFDYRDQPCRLKVGLTDLVIDKKGSLASPDGSKRVHLVLPQDFYIESVKYESTGKQVVLVFSISDAESGSTLVTLFDPNRFALGWSTEVPAFNASRPLVTDGFVYLGAIGTVTKLDLTTGRQIWRYGDLYERETQAFNSFIQPRKTGDIVIFTEDKPSTAKHRGVREVQIRDSTGDLLSK